MFSNRVISELKKVIGWKDWYDAAEIPPLAGALSSTESGQYYQDYHGLVRLDYIQALIRSNDTLDNYLDEVETGAINMMLSDLMLKKQLNNHGVSIASNDLIFQNVVRGALITNESKFVGVEFSLDEKIGIKAIINRIGLYFSAVENIDLYLFNSLQPTSILTIPYTNTAANSFQWITAALELELDKGTQSPDPDTSGGVWYLGYYQDDLAGQAIQYNSLNWQNGYCSGCGNALLTTKYMSIRKYVSMTPFYIPAASVPPAGTMFNIENVRYDYSNNYGFNFNISVNCDLSQFFIDNRQNLKQAIGTYVAGRILGNYVYSGEVSGLEQSVKDMAFEVLSGNVATKLEPFEKKMNRAIENANLDTGNVNKSPCLPCARGGQTVTFM
jgi:hypothetical protein